MSANGSKENVVQRKAQPKFKAPGFKKPGLSNFSKAVADGGGGAGPSATPAPEVDRAAAPDLARGQQVSR